MFLEFRPSQYVNKNTLKVEVTSLLRLKFLSSPPIHQEKTLTLFSTTLYVCLSRLLWVVMIKFVQKAVCIKFN